MELSPTALALIALLLAGWTVGAAYLMVRSARRASKLEAVRASSRRLGRMLDDAPAVPMLVRTDGRIEAPDRLAGWLGLDSVPPFLSELDGGAGRGLSSDPLAPLSEAVRRPQPTAPPFRQLGNAACGARGGEYR